MQLSKKLSSSRLIVIREIVHVLTIRQVMVVVAENVVLITVQADIHTLCYPEDVSDRMVKEYKSRG